MRSRSFIAALEGISGTEGLWPINRSGGYAETRPPGYLGLHEDMSFEASTDSSKGWEPLEDHRLPRTHTDYSLAIGHVGHVCLKFWRPWPSTKGPHSVVRLTDICERLQKGFLEKLTFGDLERLDLSGIT